VKATYPVLFREVQRFRDVWWIMTLVFGIAAIQWWIFLGQIVGGAPMGNRPAPDGVVLLIWLLFGIGLPVLFLLLRLEVEVTPDGVTIRFAPLFVRLIDRRDIAGAEPLTYRPLGEFGGWGVRGWGGRVAYNVRGDQGVELTLRDGRRVLIGTQRATELAAAIAGIH
jgi:hypothetical protein